MVMAIPFHNSGSSYSFPNTWIALLITLVSFLLIPSSDSVYFQLSRFDSGKTSILYDGDAVTNGGAIEFNKVNYLYRVGRAIYAERVRLWDSTSGKLSDFTTRFSFIIDTQGRLSNYGNGLAFFLAPIDFQIPPNSAGGFLGLFNTTTSDSSRNQIVLVEFDSYANPEWDPPFEHVGINNNSIASSKYTPWNASLHSGDTADAWITYNATTKNLSVFWNYRSTPNFQENSSLSSQIDLMEILPEWVIVGFSAATGQNVERHILQSWEFNSSLEVEGTSRHNAREFKLILGLTITVGVLITGGAVAIAFVILRRWRRRTMTRTVGNWIQII